MVDSSVILAFDDAISAAPETTAGAMEVEVAPENGDIQAQLAAGDASVLTVEPAVEAAAVEAAESILAAETGADAGPVEADQIDVQPVDAEPSAVSPPAAPASAAEGDGNCAGSQDPVQEDSKNPESDNAKEKKEDVDEPVAGEIETAASENHDGGNEESEDHADADSDSNEDNEGDSAEEEEDGDESSSTTSGKQRSETPVATLHRPLTRRQSALQKAQLNIKEEDEEGEENETPVRKGKGKTKTKGTAPVSSVRTRRSRKSDQGVDVLISDTELPDGITKEMLKEALAKTEFERSHDVTNDKQPVTRRRQYQTVRRDQPEQNDEENRDETEEPIGVSDLEGKFRTVKDLLDDSTLASLRKVNRRM
ncbi:hypothetical protein FBU59_006664, partial [Linderina macrospora]